MTIRLVQIYSQSKHDHPSTRMALLDGGVLLRVSSLWTATPLASRGRALHLLPLSRDQWQRARPLLAWRSLSSAPSTEFDTRSSDGGRWSARLGRYLRSLKWTPIPLCVGFALIAYQRYRFVVARERKLTSEGHGHQPVVAKPWEVSVYRLLPLRTLSRLWGCINDIDLPIWARQPVLGWYVRTFGCDLSEAVESDLLRYKNLGQLFRRRLRPHVRPVDLCAQLVSPVDGTVLQLSPVRSCRLEQIKGVTYSLHDFLGPFDWRGLATQEGDSVDCSAKAGASSHDCSPAGLCHQRLLSPGAGSADAKADTQLFQCVLYLAPGDYHRFHAPAEWRVLQRRHFAGHLLSVSPSVAGWLPSLFCLNERAIYAGHWLHGFFSMTAVGATNVGSVRVYCDQELTTNCVGWQPRKHFDKQLRTVLLPAPHSSQSSADGGETGAGVSMARGEMFGEFNLGSTIVLLFEAPADFQFAVNIGDRVRVGQRLSAS